MNCPACGEEESKVTETRCYDGKDVLRRRSCPCGASWPTKEKVCGPLKQAAPTPISGLAAAQPQNTGSPPVSHPQTTGVTGVLFPDPISPSSSGTPDPSKPNKRDRELDEPKPGAMFNQALEQFGAAWYARYGVVYRPTSADRSQLGRLIGKMTRIELAALPMCFTGYLNDTDQFIAVTQRHSLAWFCTKGNGFNKYRTEPVVVALPTARNFREEATQQAFEGARVLMAKLKETP